MFKVMIVGDQDHFRTEIKNSQVWKEHADFAVTDEAGNGRDALKKLRVQRSDLVLSDVEMPVMDGLELTKEITEKKLAECVVLLSSYSNFEYVRQGFLNGAFDFLLRPLDLKDFSQLLVKAGCYIEKKRREEKDYQIISQMALENETYYPAADVERILRGLKSGDTLAADDMAKMVGEVRFAFHNDFHKASMVIKNAVHEIIQNIFEEYKWIRLFADINDFIRMDLSKCGDFENLTKETACIGKKLVFYMVEIAHRDLNTTIIGQICAYAIENIDSSLSVKSIADKFYISKTYLSNLFKEKTGIVLTEYLTLIRMERARKMVLEGELKINEIAAVLGFKDNEYFTKIYKKYWGITPHCLRKIRCSRNADGHLNT